MSAAEFAIMQLHEQFETISRLSAELVLLRDRLVRAEMKIVRLEEAHDASGESTAMTSRKGFRQSQALDIKK